MLSTASIAPRGKEDGRRLGFVFLPAFILGPPFLFGLYLLGTDGPTTNALLFTAGPIVLLLAITAYVHLIRRKRANFLMASFAYVGFFPYVLVCYIMLYALYAILALLAILNLGWAALRRFLQIKSGHYRSW